MLVGEKIAAAVEGTVLQGLTVQHGFMGRILPWSSDIG